MSLPERLPAAWSRERQLTRRGVLWIGLRCDLRCEFCYDEHVLASQKDWLPDSDARLALRKFRFYYQNEFVDFMGGEPTLHPSILDLIRYAASMGLRPTVLTHGLHLALPERARAFADAGIHDFLISIHGLGDTAAKIHRRGRNNAARQAAALDNLRALGVPFRFNVTVIRDNLPQLESIAELAGEKGARVVNFLTFNPYFEWSRLPEPGFQVRHREAAPFLARAIGTCNRLGVEANIRYLPLCQLPGYEAHIYTGYQLPYDPHEWDYNSWYDTGHRGRPAAAWYAEAARRQQQRHGYVHTTACADCAAREICDGFHAQYIGRWGETDAAPYPGPPITDPRHFIREQEKVEYLAAEVCEPAPGHAPDTPLRLEASGGAGARQIGPAAS